MKRNTFHKKIYIYPSGKKCNSQKEIAHSYCLGPEGCDKCHFYEDETCLIVRANKPIKDFESLKDAIFASTRIDEILKKKCGVKIESVLSTPKEKVGDLNG